MFSFDSFFANRLWVLPTGTGLILTTHVTSEKKQAGIFHALNYDVVEFIDFCGHTAQGKKSQSKVQGI